MNTTELSVPKTGTDDVMPEQYRVLIVDDEALIRWSLTQVLQKASYQVSSASTAEEATLKLNSDAFDVVITDMKMPGEDGFMLAARAKKINPQCRVVMMTAFGDDGTRKRANKIGIEEFIDKPINLANIVWTVERIMK